MSKIKIGAQVTAKARPTKVTVSGTFQGYELEDQEDPTSICGKVFYIKDGKQYLAHVYIDSIEVCDSEDERIRKDLITFICQFAPEHLKAQYVAYLERQKEQKPVQTNEEKKYVKALIGLVVNEIRFGREPIKITFYQKVLNWLDGGYIEQKPAEWSEEDENKLHQVMEVLLADKTIALRENPHCKALHRAYDELLDWLKSLRPQPHWKPSEYTLSLVKKVANGEMLTHMEQMAMVTLCNDLQKLL